MKLALITGASSGIGAAVARKLAAADYKVVLVARGREGLEKIAADIGDSAIVEAVDASDGEAMLAMAQRVRSAHGVPDVIVNSAGIGEWKFIEDTSPDEAQTMMQAPFQAAYNASHVFMRDMLVRRRGVIVHVGSPASYFPWPSCVGYACSRWALRGLHESLCMDLHGTGVRSCHVLFGKVDSPYFDNNPGTAAQIPSISKTVRTISEEEAAKVILKAVRRPRRTVFHPFMLKVYVWAHVMFPWLTRWLLRRTGTVHQLPAPEESKTQ